MTFVDFDICQTKGIIVESILRVFYLLFGGQIFKIVIYLKRS